jgi:hypothetical protein
VQTDRSSKGSFQTRVIDPCEVRSENIVIFPIPEREYCVGNLDARFEKKARFCPFTAHAQGVQLVCQGKSRHLVSRFPRDGKAKQEQQPFPHLSIPPVVRAEFDDHRPLRRSAAKMAASVRQMHPLAIRKRDQSSGSEIGIS